jgi:hypothetical protein
MQLPLQKEKKRKEKKRKEKKTVCYLIWGASS